MSLPFDQQEPFHRTVQDRVVFSRGAANSDPVDIVVGYSETRPQAISGKILGNNRTYKSLKPVFDDRSDVYCRITSAFPDGPEQVSSTRVFLRKISERGWREKLPPNEPLTVVGEFECDELLIEEPCEEETARHTRSVVFYLSEAAELWRSGAREYGLRDFKLGTYPDTIDIGGEHPLSIVAEPALVYDRRATDRERIAAVIVPTLTCTTSQRVDSYADELFMEDAAATADDVSLLASLVSRCMIRWHRCAWLGPRGVQSRIRRLGVHASAEGARPTEIPEMPVPRTRFVEFARQGVEGLRSFRAQEFDLPLAIVYLVASHQAPILDERLSYALLCLERLVDHHAQRRELSKIVQPKSFDAIRRTLETEIDAQVESTPSLIVPKAGRSLAEAADLMRAKLPELNRPPFWAVLSSLLGEYGIRWDDLYPPSTPRPTLMSTRDKFIHSSQTLAPKLMFDEGLRAQALCERIILRMLGWNPDRSPMGYIRQPLTRAETPRA